MIRCGTCRHWAGHLYPARPHEAHPCLSARVLRASLPRPVPLALVERPTAAEEMRDCPAWEFKP